ncbi:unnamed protein product [Euphydryas editha]|uniref:Uncharacterized protein n=1 Tax=Euphydryas editha TaxID=104508 RepID=A0AAU9UE67_EUPED|nr:unnamed protein product [Euphydryas editha]
MVVPMQPGALHAPITITTSCVSAKGSTHEVSEKRSDRRLSKRDATIFIESYPIEPIYKHRPNVIYRRVSKQRYKSPKPKYGPPVYKYRTKPRKPVKKYRGPLKPIYGPPSYKWRPTKPKYGPPKPIKYKPKPIYGRPKKAPQISYYSPEPAGFGEPPTELTIDYQSAKQNFAEPPTDSYGSPLSEAALNPIVPEDFSPPTSFSDPSSIDNLETNFGQDFSSWQNFQSDSFDTSVAYSKKRPTFTKPQSFDLADENFDLNPYSQNDKHEDFIEENPFERKKKAHYVKESFKTKSRKLKPVETEIEDEVVVGGRYAEPPARLVPKHRQSYSIQSDDDDFIPYQGYIHPDVAVSATISPYVNYKHSNMAFSPQNLNDAFSIVH